MNIFRNINDFFHKLLLFFAKQLTFNQIFTNLPFHKNSPKGLEDNKPSKTTDYQPYKIPKHISLDLKVMLNFFIV
jgi:hypothetical protein